MPKFDLKIERQLESPVIFGWRKQVREGHAKILPVRGENNPADLFTKAVRDKLREQYLKVLGFVKDRLSS